MPPDIVRLPVPDGLACAVLHPKMEVETGAARKLLGDQVALKDATRQWANVGGLVAALYTSDLALLSRSLVDSIAEPKRASLVPGFADVKSAAIAAGALGCSLSGSGPSIFALAASIEIARAAGDAMQRAFERASTLEPTCGSVRSAGRARAFRIVDVVELLDDVRQHARQGAGGVAQVRRSSRDRARWRALRAADDSTAAGIVVVGAAR